MGLKFVDMFCGIGTIRMGMEQAGHKCVYSIEWDKHKREIYKVVFGNEPEGRDICDTRASDIPRAEVWCFGAPCQDFSIAGERKGLDGDRSSLVREVFRLIRETEEEHRPTYLLYENVKGMLSSNKGFDFFQILFEMESLGYDRIEYSLLNSKNFGVPQNRERVFTIGHFRGRGTRKIFPIVTTVGCKNPGVTLTARGYGSQRNGTYVVENPVTLRLLIPGADAQRVYDGRMLGRTLKGESGGQGGKMGLYLIKDRIRQLTPRETWRMQGIPDHITDRVINAGISDTQMYRGAGDACTVKVIYEIAKRL
ncbi:DNA cytosine methyltransferase [Anaerosolibacter sp.]|uniref:DNA cytosine methyltransferase n=1 Tax=Anaerosolibacter sp. TaxID=1872527 RepID=UPI0039F08C90